MKCKKKTDTHTQQIERRREREMEIMEERKIKLLLQISSILQSNTHYTHTQICVYEMLNGIITAINAVYTYSLLLIASIHLNHLR